MVTMNVTLPLKQNLSLYIKTEHQVYQAMQDATDWQRAGKAVAHMARNRKTESRD